MTFEHILTLFNDTIARSSAGRELLLATGGAMLLFFFVQLWYYLSSYGRLHRFRNGVRTNASSDPVSVIVVIRENTFYYIENYLPLLLEQDYDEYEVVAVDCSYSEEIGEMLAGLAQRYPHLKTTRIKAQANHKHSIKLALTVGIKASSYENLLFTTVDSFPVSEKWVSLMAKGFINGEVVLGYCGIEPRKGLANKWMRCSRLMTSVRYLSSAARGAVYRGIAHNIGYTKSLYFDHKGFDHLNMNIGDDDLFIAKIATRRNTSIVLHPKATTRQLQYGGLCWWNSLCKYNSYAYRYYPAGIRWRTGLELLTRMLFFAAAGALAVWLPTWWKALPLGFVLIRLWIVEFKMRQIIKRFGERKILGSYVIYDLLSPASEFILALNRRIRPNKAIWR